MTSPLVAVLRTNPKRVLKDFGKVMRLAGYQEEISKDLDTILKINISWQHFFPACSTTPWQLDGVVTTMVEDGYDVKRLIPAQNRTVVVDPRVGAVSNKHNAVAIKHGLEFLWLFERQVKWVKYEPKAEMICLNETFPDGIMIPEALIGKNAIHLPTVKTHVFTTTTGAMKNAFGGLLNENRHWCHARIHESLVDLLAIQKEIHPGLFAVMDGTYAGNGPGPRAMIPVEKNVILASKDQVAIDAMAAKMMGFDPMKLDYIRIATERGLGCGDPTEIELVGDNISKEDWGFAVGDTFASRGQKTIYHGCLKPLERLLLRSPIVPWSYIASRMYHDAFWFPVHGRRCVSCFMNSGWGKLFQQY